MALFPTKTDSYPLLFYYIRGDFALRRTVDLKTYLDGTLIV